jgi:hypothetical protein
MKLRLFVGSTFLAALAVSSYGQTLPEQTTAAGIAGGIATKAAPSGLNAAKKAKLLKQKADGRYAGMPSDGPQWGEPAAHPGKAGAAAAAKGSVEPPATPAPAPPQPWMWRLKGLATGNKGRVAAFESPDGRMTWAKVGEKLDARTKIVKIERHRVIVHIDEKAVDLRPW